MGIRIDFRDLGCRVRIDDDADFTVTEEQLIRVGAAIDRTFSRSERIRRLCQRNWCKKCFKLMRGVFDGWHVSLSKFRLKGTVIVEVEAFVRALKKKDQADAVAYLRERGVELDLNPDTSSQAASE